MKKFVAIVLGFCMCLMTANGAFAFEEGSLETQTTFFLYDDDPYDLSIDPGRLYQIDRWRLYTNLSNYENSGGYYMIGTSGKFGPGSVALFFETHNYLSENEDTPWTYYSEQNLDPTETVDTVYTGTEDYIEDADPDYATKYKNEQTRSNLYLGYSLDFDPFSIGIGLTPEMGTNKQTLTDGGAISPPSLGSLSSGSNYSDTYTETTYGSVDHSKYRTETQDTAFAGDSETDINNYTLTLSSDIRPSDMLDIQVTFDYTTLDIDEDGSATKNYSLEHVEVGDTTGAVGEFPTVVLTDGYMESYDWTSTWNGSILAETRDGSEMSLLIDPTYTFNDNVAITFLVGYESGSGDLDGGYTQQVSYEERNQADATANVETITGAGTADNSYSGDWDSSEISITPMLFLTYGPVEFSLGMEYISGKEERDYQTRIDYTMTNSYNDGDVEVNDADDYTMTGSYTGVRNDNEEETYTEINFPVGTRYQMTDKVSLRAGALFSRTTTKYESVSSSNTMVNENYFTTYGDGTTDTYGPESQIINSVESAYDADTEREGESNKEKHTTDTTYYRLGLGYQATENLVFDFMFSGSNGGVNTDVVYVSAVLAF